MKHGPDIAALGALIGDPARANILTALIGGCALTATELSIEAGVTKQTTSSHLAKLLNANFVKVEKQGRHRYYTIANHEISTLLETMMNIVAGQMPHRVRIGPKQAELRKARRCYDHLAGELAVQMFESLIRRNLIEIDDDKPIITPIGKIFFAEFDIDVEILMSLSRPICRTCLDWSVRRAHLAGSLGAAILNKFFLLSWIKPISKKSRVIEFTEEGEKLFHQQFLT